MSKYFKKFLGITSILTLIFHGLVLSYYSIADDYKIEDSPTYVSNSFISELPGDSPMQTLSDQSVIVLSKTLFFGDSLNRHIISVYAFHFENYVNSIIEISQKNDLIFDIKALKLPTH